MDADVAADARTLTMVHVFDASCERVFAAWIDPAQFVQWFGPPGMRNTHCAFDLRPGGGWAVTAEGLGVRRAVSGRYREIDPPRRLVFTWAWHEAGTLESPREHETVVALDFRPLGSRCELTLTHGPFRDRAGTDNHRRGWTGSFGKLAALLAAGREGDVR